MIVTNPRCEGMTDPLGLGERQPRLSWTLQTERRGARQTAYELEVLEEGLLKWNTGRIESDAVQVRYAGPALPSRGHSSWWVRVWDERGEVSPWSRTAHWEMGLLDASDWQAKWIEPVQESATPEPEINFFAAMGTPLRTPDGMESLPEKLHPCPLLRRAFTLSGRVKSARLYATAHGLYRLHLNGVRVGAAELTPENTSYHHFLMVQTYDVTALLQVGENVLGAVLADGWYAGRTAANGANLNYGNRLALLAQLEIERADGGRVVIGTDGKWRSFRGGPWVYSDLFIGERFDARREIAGWTQPGFDGGNWDAVTLPGTGFGNLVPQDGEAVRVTQELPVQAVVHTPAGETVLDFGQVIAGRVRMRVRGPAGTQVVLQHSEVLDERGNFFQNIRWRNKEQTDIYVLNGQGEETYEPAFTFHGFRYVKVSGYPGEIGPQDFTACVLGSDLALAGEFSTSHAGLNQLQQNIVWSQRGNFLSVPTDCPQRERTGWTGDMQVFAPTALFSMRLDAFLTRWLRQVGLEQLPDGQIPNYVPGTPSMAEPFGSPSSAGWGDACIIVPWALYQEYGDLTVLHEHYPTMQRWLAYVRREAENGLPEGVEDLSPAGLERQKSLWNTGFHFGDWLIPSLPNPLEGVQATKELVATCFYASSARLMAEIAGLLGHAEESARYRELHGKIAEAFAAEYLQGSRLKAHFQGLYVLALHGGLIPEPQRAAVARTLVDMIEANGDRLDTGFMSIPHLLDVLCDHGHREVAYRLLFQTTCPSWLYQVERGATTTWEAWDAIKPDGEVRAVSFNHYAFGCVGDWMYRHLAGLRKGAPGYRHTVMKPAFDCGLTSARASHQSVHGEVSSAWALKDGQLRLRVVIPPGTTATVCLPAAPDISLDGQPLQSGNGVQDITSSAKDLMIRVQSGEYLFTVLYAPGLNSTS